MNTVSRILLRAKHWQIFLVTFVLPAISIIGLSLIRHGLTGQAMSVSATVGTNILTLVILISTVTLCLWRITAGIECRKQIPAQERMNSTLFLFATILLAVFFMATQIRSQVAHMALNRILVADNVDSAYISSRISAAEIGIMLAARLIAFFCTFYVAYCLARTFRSMELGRKASLGDYMGDFFLFLFFFAGVWVLQPRLNLLADKLLANESESVDVEVAQKDVEVAQKKEM